MNTRQENRSKLAFFLQPKMELWWIILAGCGGGLLLIAYVGFVIYKIVRHRKRKYQRDPEGLTDGRDWTVHIHDHFERRVDGLCMDTISGSAKLRRKPIIPGEEEAVLQSIFKVSSPPNVPKGKHDGPQRTSGEMSRLNGVTGPNNTSPKVIQRSEYTWENLLRQPSDVRMTRSHTINHDLTDHRSPMRLDATTRSLNFDRDLQRRQQKVRSKSLRAHKSREPESNNLISVDETIPFTRITVCERPGQDINKNESSEKSPLSNRNKDLVNFQANKTQDVNKTRRISRSGSAPSTQAKETVMKNEADGLQRKRSVSLRWIPEPDYQSVTIDELVSATQSTEEDYHRQKAIRSESGSGELVGIEKTENLDRNKNESSSRFSKDGGDFVRKFSIPGVAQRISTDKALEKSRAIVSDLHNEEAGLDKDRIQALDHQIPPERPNSGQYEGTTAQRNTVDERAANQGHSNSNSDPETRVNLKKIPAVEEKRNEYVIGNNQSVVSSVNKPSEEASIGKMKIVKNETRPWMVSQERTLKYPIKDNSATGLNSTSTKPKSQPTSTGNAAYEHNKPDLGSRLSTSDLVKAALRNQTKSNDYNNNIVVTMPLTTTAPPSDNQVLEVPDIALKADSSLAATDLKPNVSTPKDNDAGLTLEERKRHWKREQIVDQLHSARQNNVNQNFIFGTGLAYQSCMPELQNKLKQLTMTK
ncbi:unnamed protein product [Porites evermanni]|uniref:Uncharacterized protein n=1 Tax=Porites evermanni TaxID=104178 RepID=A0ABN8LTS6_9CNID|nr:unnamed protein product [Porites evermanni]